MKKFYSLAAALFVLSFLFAKDVDVNYAKQVATNFYLQNNHEANNVSLQLAEAYTMPAGVGDAEKISAGDLCLR